MRGKGAASVTRRESWLAGVTARARAAPSSVPHRSVIVRRSLQNKFCNPAPGVPALGLVAAPRPRLPRLSGGVQHRDAGKHAARQAAAQRHTT